jgi:hypothetical protein
MISTNMTEVAPGDQMVRVPHSALPGVENFVHFFVFFGGASR